MTPREALRVFGLMPADVDGERADAYLVLEKAVGELEAVKQGIIDKISTGTPMLIGDKGPETVSPLIGRRMGPAEVHRYLPARELEPGMELHDGERWCQIGWIDPHPRDCYVTLRFSGGNGTNFGLYSWQIVEARVQP